MRITDDVVRAVEADTARARNEAKAVGALMGIGFAPQVARKLVRATNDERLQRIADASDRLVEIGQEMRKVNADILNNIGI